MEPFVLQASAACPTHADLALALAAEFHAVVPALSEAALDELAAPLAGAALDDPADALAAVGEEVATRLRPHRSWTTLDDLLLDRVLAQGAGHPVALAIACAEAGQRAGVPLGVVAGRCGAFVAHAALAEPLLVEPARGGRVVHASQLEGAVRWQCAHQTAARLLDVIVTRAERIDHLAWALRASALRLALPFERAALERAREHHDRVRSRLN